jgi:ribosomal protein S18 acetylase RimI-like enzyme
VRICSAEETAVAAQLLHDFNAEFDTPTPPVALLEELYVRPDLRGRGIGAALLTAAVAAAKDRGVTYVEINVDEGDLDAQRFYRAHGFTDIEYPETGERAFYFHKDLSR